MNNDSRQRLNRAFAFMRRGGLIARQAFSCCGSCAGYELATEVSAMVPGRRAKVLGACTYHKQAAATLKKGAKGIYLGYGQIDTTDHGLVGLSSKAVGEMIVAYCTDAGLVTEWDGDINKRIYVVLP